MNELDAKHLVRRLVDEEFLSEYRSVRRMPSTEIWKTLAYLDTLDDRERDTIFDLWAERGSVMLTPVDYERQMELAIRPAASRDRVLAYDNRSLLSRFGNVWVVRGDLRVEQMDRDELNELLETTQD